MQSCSKTNLKEQLLSLLARTCQCCPSFIFQIRAEICSAGVDRWANPKCVYLGGTQPCTYDVDVDLAGSTAGRCATRPTEIAEKLALMVNLSCRCMCCRKAFFQLARRPRIGRFREMPLMPLQKKYL